MGKSLAKLDNGCTSKQDQFAREYPYDWNGTQAAIRAGYSEKTAGAIAAELLKKPHVQKAIEVYRRDLERLAGVSKLMAINELKKYAFTDFSEFQDTWFTKRAFEDLSDDAKACIQEIDSKVIPINIGTKDAPDFVDVEHIRIKLVDKRGALQDLAKMLGWNDPDRIAIESKNMNVNVNTGIQMLPDQITDLISRL